MNAAKLSTCCAAPVYVEGRTTHWYACSKCGKPCEAKESS